MTINFAQCGNYKFLTTNVFIIATKIVICKVIIPFKGYWQVHLSEAICPEVFYKKAGLKKFTWKHQRQCFFFNKVASLIVTKLLTHQWPLSHYIETSQFICEWLVFFYFRNIAPQWFAVCTHSFRFFIIETIENQNKPHLKFQAIKGSF